jgi:transglutaminase-like putative cysteine protease
MRVSVVDTNRSSGTQGPSIEPLRYPPMPGLNNQGRPAGSGRSPVKVSAPPALRQRAWIPEEGWFAFVLLAVALYSVVIAIVRADWVAHSAVLLWSPVVGLLIGFCVAKAPRLPQAILHVAGCLVGHWFSIFLTSTIAFHISWLVLLGDLRAVVLQGLAPTVVPNTDMIFFFYLSFLCFFLGYFGCWLIYRAHLPWLVALVYCSIMLVNLNGYTKQDLSYLVIILIGALLLLIARIQLTQQVLQWTREGLHTDAAWLRSITSRCMQVASVLTLLILLCTYLLPSLSQPASGEVLWNKVDNAWTNIINGHFSLQNPAALTQPYQPAANFFGSQLTITGSVHLPVGEVLSYTSSGGGRNLEGFTFNLFDGHTWSSSLTAANGQDVNASVPTNPDVGRTDSTQLVTTVTIMQPPEGVKHYLFGPAQPTMFDVGTIVYGDRTAASWTQRDPLAVGERYQVVSTAPTTDVQVLSVVPLPSTNPSVWASDPNAAVLSKSYTQVPRDLTQNVFVTAKKWTAGATSAYGVLKMLEAHLGDQNIFTYSIDNPPIPSNVDVVDWLLQTRSGYCTYYATAMAVMARQLGIPTRVVNGFSHGHFDGAKNAWVVNGEDAHSWVQAYLPGLGWISFDPTPGFVPLSVGGGAKPTPTATPSAKPTPTKKPTPVPPGQKSPTPTGPQPTTAPRSSSSGFALDQGMLEWFSVFVVLCSLGFFVYALVTSWWRRLYADQRLISALYWRFCHVASWLGLSPKKWQTPYEYSSVLARSFPQKAGVLWHLTDLFVRERWGGPQHLPHPQEEVEARYSWLHLRDILITQALKHIKK